MAIGAISWAFDVHKLSPRARLVLLHLANRANHLNNAWPTVRGIVADLEMSRADVMRCLALLRRRGFIYPLGYGGKTGQAVVYRLAGRWDSRAGKYGEWLPPEGSQPETPHRLSGRPGWSHTETPPVSDRDTQPSINRKRTVKQPAPAPLGDAGAYPIAEVFSNLKEVLGDA